MSDGEFLRCTWRHLTEMGNVWHEEFKARRSLDDWRTARIEAMLFNVNRGEGVEPRSASDFMPKYADEQDEQATPVETDEARLARKDEELARIIAMVAKSQKANEKGGQ